MLEQQAEKVGQGDSAARSYPLWLWLSLSALVIVLDQLSKYAITSHFAYNETLTITPFFDLIRAHNQGAAFGFLNTAGGWQRWMFTAIAVAASILIVVLLRKHGRQKLFCLALALILGGALGNLIDRIAYGFVVDFLDFHWNEHHFAAFNLADSAITCGAGLLLLESYINHRRERAARTASTGV
ncbi:MAG TPA: signal peptidase II [Gallionellaceae bacterium]